MSQNRTVEGPVLDTVDAPGIHRSYTGVGWGVQDSRKNVGIAGFRWQRFRLTGRRVGAAEEVEGRKPGPDLGDGDINSSLHPRQAPVCFTP